jgi:hypothetical protein
MELAVVLVFNNVETTEKVDVEIEWHGPKAETPVWYSDQSIHQLHISNALRFEQVSPAVTFRTIAQSIRPQDTKISPLGTRDIFDNGIQINGLILNYKFSGKPKDFETKLI